MNGVRVRAIPVDEVTLEAWIVAVLGGLWSIAYLGGGNYDLVPFVGKWWGVSVVLCTWIAGTLLATRRRPFVARAVVEKGVLRAGSLRIRVDDAAARIARAERGYSVAISRAGHGAFFEVESEADARRLLAMIGVPWPGHGTVAFNQRQPHVRLVQRLCAMGGTLSAFLYGVFVAGLEMHDAKGVFGIGALVLGGLSSLLFVLDPFFRAFLRPGARERHLLGRDDVDAHARLHDLSTVDPDAAPPREAATPLAREAILAATNETTRAWLDRIDQMARGTGGYRGDAPAQEELYGILENPSADASARLAAARMLALAHGKGEPELRARIADDALAPRVRIVVAEDADAVADELDVTAPAFHLGRGKSSPFL